MSIFIWERNQQNLERRNIYFKDNLLELTRTMFKANFRQIWEQNKKWLLFFPPMGHPESENVSCSVVSNSFCTPMDCSSPDSSVYGILQARILESGAIHLSRVSSLPRDQTQVPALQVDSLPSEAPGKPIGALYLYVWSLILMRTSYVNPQHSHATPTSTSTSFLPPYLFIFNILTCTILSISNTFCLSEEFSLLKLGLLKTQFHISSEWLFHLLFVILSFLLSTRYEAKLLLHTKHFHYKPICMQENQVTIICFLSLV